MKRVSGLWNRTSAAPFSIIWGTKKAVAIKQIRTPKVPVRLSKMKDTRESITTPWASWMLAEPAIQLRSWYPSRFQPNSMTTSSSRKWTAKVNSGGSRASTIKIRKTLLSSTWCRASINNARACTIFIAVPPR